MALQECSLERVLWTRHELLRRTACGFGNIALLGMLDSVVRAATPQFRPRAKQVIFLFMPGGVSHIDSFDPKPELDRFDGQPLPYETPLQFAEIGNLMKSP